MVIIGIDPHKRTHTASALEPGSHRVLSSVEFEAALGGLSAVAVLGVVVPRATVGGGERS